MKFEGECHFHNDCCYGWARNSERSGHVWVELFHKDLSLGVALANLDEPNGCGFFLQIPSGALDDADKLDARVANTDFVLPRKAINVEDNAALQGQIYLCQGLILSGWARDPENPDRSISLYAWENNKRIAATSASQRYWRPDSATRHGFNLYLPLDLADGEVHNVHIRDEKGRDLPGSPVKIRTIPNTISELLESGKELSSRQRSLLLQILRNMESQTPGATGMENYESWEQAFPVPLPEGKSKIVLQIPFCDNPKKIIANQKCAAISLAGNRADYVLLIDREDSLRPHAIASLASSLRERGTAMIYADGEDMDGMPFFKPAWDRLSFLARDCLGPILAKADIFDSAGITGQDSYAVCRMKLALTAEKKGGISHLPQILSRHKAVANFPERLEAARALVSPTAESGPGDTIKINFPLAARPAISLIIPTRNHAEMLRRCLHSLRQTDWPELEIIIVDNGSDEKDVLELLQTLSLEDNIKILDMPGPFNYSWLNNRAAEKASGDLLCFLNNDTEILCPTWLEEMASLLLEPSLDAGCVGAKLLWPNRIVQHGGVVMGVHQLAAHVGNAWREDDPGYMGRNLFAQQYSAVTAACMLTRKDLFMGLGGFDERDFAVSFNDVDYCMRLREIGKKIYWTPHALLLHHESASRGHAENVADKGREQREMGRLRAKWGHYADMFHNPNLSLSIHTDPFGGLAFPPRSRKAR